MTRDEREFLNDIKDALDEWDFSYEHYHEDGSFCIDIKIDDMDEWGEDPDEIWNALSEVCDEWGAGIDSDCNYYYIAINFD